MTSTTGARFVDTSAWYAAADRGDTSYQAATRVDRTSFAVMERLGLYRVATFDHDFAVYRFGLRRDRAFVVVG